VASEWFPGKGRNEDDEAFLARLRQRADDEGVGDALPEDTAVAEWWEDEDLVPCVEVRRLGTDEARPTIQACIQRWDEGEPRLVTAWETYGHLLDAQGLDPMPTGELSPVGRADVVFNWLVDQLRRPVELWAWDSRWRRTARMWRLADDGNVICADPRAYQLVNRGRTPDRISRLR
jgi:hypothetical protein